MTDPQTADLRSQLRAVVTDREVVEVAGPDAAAFLQGQLSQDVVGLADGDSAWTFVLNPDGKVAVWCRVTRLSGDRFVLDVDGGFGEALVTRLSRFKLRIDATVAPLDWSVVAVRGPGSASVDGGDAVVIDPGWPGVEGIDLLGASAAVPDGVPQADPAALEVLRIEAGVPRMGTELTESTIPAEAGVVERSVSFTKGCYTGQELTARIDSRGGNVPRHLRGLIVPGEAPPAGAEIMVDGAAVGSVTSAAATIGHHGAIALGYVGRAVDPPVVATVRWDGGEAPAEVRALPLVP